MAILFEFEDLSWFPASVRHGMTDYLGILLKRLKFYQPVVPILEGMMETTGLHRLTDLCSGNGGPVDTAMDELAGRSLVTYTLTDKFPNTGAWEKLNEKHRGKLTFFNGPVDILDDDLEVAGIATMYSAAHHFSPEQLQAVLGTLVGNGTPVAIFDSGDKHIGTILGIIIFHPVLFFLCTPFFKPFRWDRIVFTYLVPLIPICTVWDGVVSILRLYSRGSFLKIARAADPEAAFEWTEGYMKNRFGFRVHYLTGIPKAMPSEAN